MRRAWNGSTLDRRRFLTGAGAALGAVSLSGVSSQEPAPTPIPIRIQTPDLAFVDALQQQLEQFQIATGPNDLILSIVPAEPASDSLLSDLRSNNQRFSGALVPWWLVPDLVRGGFIAPANPPPRPLPPAIATLRSFGGEWVATDFDHDCDLLFLRADRVSSIPETWSELLDLAETNDLALAIPQTHAQQAVDHFCSMAASVVGTGEFWLDPDPMDPLIASPAHREALETWKALSDRTPAAVRTGSTGDLWQSFVEGETVALVASAAFLPFALQTRLDSAVLIVAELPGWTAEDGVILRAGNTTGTNWGGVTIAGTADQATVGAFLDALAQPDAQHALAASVTSGVTPAALDAQAELDALTAAGWPEVLTASWLDTISATVGNPLQLSPLRIAETRRYLLSLENHIVAYLASDSGSAEDMLQAAATEWRDINQAIDIDIQRELYGKSRMAAPGQ